MIILSIIFKILAIVVFLYLSWRRMGGDYGEAKVVAFSWIALLSFFIGSRLAYGLINWGVWNDSWLDWWAVWEKPGMVYSGGYVGFLIVTGIISLRNEWKYWSFLEDNVFVFLSFLLLWLAGEVIGVGSDSHLVKIMAVAMITFLTFQLTGGKYRSFVWYKSGKKGFLFFWANVLFWLIYLLTIFLFNNGEDGWGFALALVLLSAGGLFILGEVLRKE